MKKKCCLLFAACCLLAATAWGQTNFRAGWEKANPVAPETTLAFEEKVKAHQAFLDQAAQGNDALQRLYGFLYLFHDYLGARDFPEATRCLLEAETIAQAPGNPGWQGAVSHRRGVLSVRLKHYRDAIEPFKASVALCRAGGDSLGVAEGLEQLGAMYAMENDFEQSRKYFDLAFPLVEKYDNEKGLSATLSNFGALLNRQNRPAEAIPYFERAIAIRQKIGGPKLTAQTLNNLGEAYTKLRRFDEAIETFNKCVRINAEFNQPQNMINNFAGLADSYQGKGDCAKELAYSTKYYELQDSLIGAKTRMDIAEVEAKYNGKQKELELQKSQAALTASRRTLERGAALAFCSLLLVAFGLWRWRTQARHAQQTLAQRQAALADLTRILLEKNTQLAALAAQAPEQPHDKETLLPPTPLDFEENFYSQRILTHADWAAFKSYFEKAHPGYLLRLRRAYPALTDAEERLFLFLKLNLTSKEAAAMLGISADSVKRTRNRLRQRMGLQEKEDLEMVVQGF